jgi:hypothetical protein
VTVSAGLALKPVVTVFRFGPQNQRLWFGDLFFKITATFSWFESQNQVAFGLSIAPQNRRREVGAGHASRSSGMLRMESSLARVSQSGLKTTEARRRVVHVAPSRRLRQRQVEDERFDVMDCVGPCYPTFTIFNVLGL